MIRSIYGVRYTDMGPFRAIRRAALERLDMREQTYGWSIEMQTKAAARNLKVKEVPVRWRNRAAGESKVAGTITGSIRAGARIVWTILRVAVTETRRKKNDGRSSNFRRTGQKVDRFIAVASEIDQITMPFAGVELTTAKPIY